MTRFVVVLALAVAPTSLGFGGPGWLPAGSRVVALLSQDAGPYRSVLQGFQDQLTKSAPGVEVSVHFGPAGKDASDLLTTIRRDGPGLILALGSAAVDLARRLDDVPVVAGMVLHASDVALGPRFTGVFLDFPAEVSFAHLKRILPGQRRVAVLYNPAENQAAINEAARVARGFGFELLARRVRASSDIPDILKSLTNSADVLWGIADTLVLTPETARPILLFSLQNRIPFVGLSGSWAKAGAVYALDRDYTDMGRQCGELAGKVLAGQAPDGLPPVPPRKVIYLINRRIAEPLKLTIPREALQGAEEVIE